MPLPKQVLLLPYLAEVCKEARETKDINPMEIALGAGFSAPTSITRDFEQDTSAWGKNPDAVVMAYARATKVPVFDLWDKAVERARAAKADLEWMKD
jgi:hypothetical protein